MTEAKKASLTVLGGPLAGARCALPDKGVVTIGSDEGSSLHLALPGVGALHARVVVEPGSATVHEEGQNRVFVNDSPVGESGTLLHNGDVVWLGAPGDDDAVMLQCLLPRRPIEAHVAVVPEEPPSPEVTLAAIPLPAETFISAPQAEAPSADPSFELPPDEQQAETVVLQGDRGEELVFADDGNQAAEAQLVEPIYAEAVVEPEAAVESSGPHVVVPDFETAVFVDTPPTAEVAAEPEPADYAPIDAADFEGATLEPVVEEPVAPPPVPAARPQAPPRAPSPDSTHAPQVRSPQASQQIRPPHATHPPQGHPPYATLPSGARRARKAPAKPGGGAAVGVGIAAVLVLAAAGWAGWKYVWPRFASKPAPPVAAMEPTPQPIAAPPTVPPSQPTPEPSVAPTAEPSTPATTLAPTPPTATPTPRTSPSPSPRTSPTPSPRATPTPPTGRPTTTPPTTTAAGPSPAAQAQTLVAQAEAALAGHQYEAAIGNADAALRLDPGNARATTVRADATRQRDLSRRRFVAGRTVVQTQKAGNSDLSGFDSGGADVRKAPDFQGRIEFEMSPASGLDSGTAWRLQIFVVNEGKKGIRVQGLTVTTNVNGAAAATPVPPAAREIAPQQRALVGETSGSWRDGTTSWTSEAAITANKGDSLRNTLTWR